MKVRPNISVDKDVWDWWMKQQTVNKSALINQMLIEEKRLRMAGGEQ